MLQYGAIEPNTLRILKQLMQVQALQDFYLVGGTALALQFGHRLSVDIDLFSISEFENDSVIKILEENFQEFTYRNKNNPVGIFGYFDNIKVDMINYSRYKLISEPLIIDDIRMYNLKDILAMKIAAILKRGVKKDFWDIAELLLHFTVQDCIDCYTRKFPSQQLIVSIPFAMTYFIDAEESEEPISLKGQTWESIKNFISLKVTEYFR
jgi:predicted nucleotidyltransferase component of viral defense system